MNKTTGVIAAVLMAAAGAGYGQTTEGWHFEATPYVWYAGLEGDATIKGREVEFEKDASDLLEAADMGGSIRLGAAYNRFVVGALVDYFSLSTDNLDAEDQPERASMDAKMLMTEVAAGYRVDGWSEGQSFVFALGVRNLHTDNELELKGKGTFNDERDITDAMIYVLPSVPLFSSRVEGLRFNPVMGIGAGDSDLAYELFPQIQYEITDTVALRLGYRRVGWKFEGAGGNELNASLAGLIAGVGLKF